MPLCFTIAAFLFKNLFIKVADKIQNTNIRQKAMAHTYYCRGDSLQESVHHPYLDFHIQRLGSFSVRQ